MVNNDVNLVGSRNDTARLSVTLPSDHHDMLLKLAERKKVSLAWVVRDAVEKYLENTNENESE